MKQTTGDKNSIVMIVVGEVNSVGYEERLRCCQQLANALGVNGVVEPEAITPAFPDSLFLSDEELTKVVHQCNDAVLLQAMYQENHHRTEQKPVLQQMFAARQKELELKNSRIDC